HLSSFKFMSENKLITKGRLSYFELFDYNKWSLDHFDSCVRNNFGHMKDNANIFYKILHIVKNDASTSQKVRKTVNALMIMKHKT
ncbi:4275_t:CDS:1, partial [Dentiscutata erythropus]